MANFDIIVKAVDQTKGTFSNIERSLNSISGLAARVGGALAGAFSVKAVLDAGRAYQTLDVQLRGVTGSAEASRATLGSLTTLANELGISVDDLALAFRNLKSTGLDTSAQSLKAYAGIAAATGSTVENIADAIGNAYQGSFGKIGKATNDLIEVENKYGQYVVRIGGQVKGQVATTGQVVDLIKNYAANNAGYASALKGQAESIQASFNKVTNAVTTAFSQSGLDKSIAATLNNLASVATQGGGLTEAFKQLATALDALNKNFELFAKVIGLIAFIAVGNKIKALGTLIYSAASSVATAIGAITTGARSLGSIVTITTAAGKEISIFTAIASTLANSWKFVVDIFKGSFGTFGTVIGAIVAGGASIGVFGTTLLKLGSLIFKFMGGPWGVLLAGILTFSDEILAAGRNLLEFFGILDRKVELKVDANKTAETFKRLGIQGNETAGGGRGGQGGATAKELADYQKAMALPKEGAGKPADTYLADLIGNFGKARSELNQLQTAMKNTKDINLMAKMFDEASSRAEQFGIVLEKNASLIQRQYAIDVAKTTEQLRQQEIQLANDAVTQQKWKNEIQATSLEIYEQSLRIADTEIITKKWYNEIAQTNLQLMENTKKLQNSQIQVDIFSQELMASAQSLQQQEQRLAMTGQMAERFAQEIRTTNIELATNSMRLADSGIMAQKFAQEILGAQQAIAETALKLADAGYQQGLFTNNITQSRQSLEQNKITLNLLNEAYAAGTISLKEYADALGQVDQQLLGLNETKARALSQATDDLRQQDLGTQAAKDLTQQLRSGTISWRQYNSAISKLDSEGVKRSFINIDAEILRAKSTAEVFGETLMESSKKAGDALAGSLADGILKGKLSLNSFKDFFNSILDDIATAVIKKNIVGPIVDALTGATSGIGGGGGFDISKLFGSISGGGGGGFGDIFGNIGSFFSDIWPFAEGGIVTSPMMGLVGEAGPEAIIPLDKLDDMKSGAPTVNFTINAIDTQTGVEFLMKNKPQIVGMIQQAYNSQGKRGVYK